MYFHPVDAITAALFFLCYSNLGDVKEARKKAADLTEAVEKDKAARTKNGEWTEAMELAYQNVQRAVAGDAFRRWFSENSPIGTLCGGFISFVFGVTSAPGAILGFLFTAPRAWGLVIMTFSVLFGSGQQNSAEQLPPN